MCLGKQLARNFLIGVGRSAALRAATILRVLRSSTNRAPLESHLNFAIFLKSLAACERQSVVTCHRSARKATAK